MPLMFRCCFRQHTEKLLLGLNFYGRDFSAFGVKDVMGNEYHEASALSSAVRNWDEAFQEHVLLYKRAGEKHIMFYPSIKSLQVSTFYPAIPFQGPVH